jgi:hypothetical protein
MLLSTKRTFDLLFFSFLLHKIIVLIFDMFIYRYMYAKVGHSKFIEMRGDASEFYLSALVFNTRQRVNITIYRTVYLYTDMCKS